MKVVLICPSRRPGLAQLCESAPLAITPIFGECAVNHWIEHLASLGARQVKILAPDYADELRTAVGDGARWGVQIEVIATAVEPTLAEAAARHRPAEEPGWLPAPHDVVRLTHLPNCPELPLYQSYASWFAAAVAWMPLALTPVRVRVSEIRPEIWVGRRAYVSPKAKLIGPCWIGDQVYVEAGAVVGPEEILEDRVFVDKEARVSHSWVGPGTLVGPMTAITESLAWGDRLTNWRTESSLYVTDPFLLSPLVKAAQPAARRTKQDRRDSLELPRRFSTGFSANSDLAAKIDRILPMKIENFGQRLSISEIPELTAVNSSNFREEINSALSSSPKVIEIDLSQTRFVDSSGLGALFALYRTTGEGNGVILRLLNPAPEIQQLLELTQMQQLFEIVQR